jgi:hypothetical protein
LHLHRSIKRKSGGSGVTEEREGGAWIGQHPDENTERVREEAEKQDAERVAVTDNESSELPADESDEWPAGHREGRPVSDDDVRNAGGSG